MTGHLHQTSPKSARPTSSWRRAGVAVLGLVLIGGLGYGLLAFLNDVLSFGGKWEGKIRSAVPSPDGRYVAEVSDWNGGATTGFETRVALRPRSGRDTVTGVTRSEGTVAVLFGSPKVRLRWDAPQQLTIESPDGHFTEQRATWRDVRLEYQKSK